MAKQAPDPVLLYKQLLWLLAHATPAAVRALWGEPPVVRSLIIRVSLSTQAVVVGKSDLLCSGPAARGFWSSKFPLGPSLCRHRGEDGLLLAGCACSRRTLSRNRIGRFLDAAADSSCMQSCSCRSGPVYHPRRISVSIYLGHDVIFVDLQLAMNLGLCGQAPRCPVHWRHRRAIQSGDGRRPAGARSVGTTRVGRQNRCCFPPFPANPGPRGG